MEDGKSEISIFIRKNQRETLKMTFLFFLQNEYTYHQLNARGVTSLPVYPGTVFVTTTTPGKEAGLVLVVVAQENGNAFVYYVALVFMSLGTLCKASKTIIKAILQIPLLLVSLAIIDYYNK